MARDDGRPSRAGTVSVKRSMFEPLQQPSATHGFFRDGGEDALLRPTDWRFEGMARIGSPASVRVKR